MTSKELRRDIADLLAGTLPADVLVRHYLTQPDNVPYAGLVMVGIDGGSEAPEWGCGDTYRLEVVVAVGTTKPGAADDALDDLADLVRKILADAPTVRVPAWTRGVLVGTESQPTYSITAEVVA